MGRVEEAKAVIQKIGKGNKRPVPDQVLAMVDKVGGQEKGSDDAQGRKINVLDLFRPRPMALRTINMCYQVRG